jgi:hypothetical protein
MFIKNKTKKVVMSRIYVEKYAEEKLHQNNKLLKLVSFTNEFYLFSINNK